MSATIAKIFAALLAMTLGSVAIVRAQGCNQPEPKPAAQNASKEEPAQTAAQVKIPKTPEPKVEEKPVVMPATKMGVMPATKSGRFDVLPSSKSLGSDVFQKGEGRLKDLGKQTGEGTAESQPTTQPTNKKPKTQKAK